LSEVTLAWLGVADLVAGTLPPEGASVLLADLADPRVAQLGPLAPTPRDVQDAARPLAGPRDHFLGRRALLRRLVAARLGLPAEAVTIGHDEAGRPQVEAPGGSGLHLSVSARGTLAALALAPLPVGVDLEPVGDPKEPVWDVLHARERGEIESVWKVRAEDWPFLSIWTAKEAYLKALGLGLKREPARLHVAYEGDDMFLVHDPDAHPHQWPGATCRAEIGSTPIICSLVLLPA
jgi:phosphopantetheinyl transferase